MPVDTVILNTMVLLVCFIKNSHCITLLHVFQILKQV